MVAAIAASATSVVAFQLNGGRSSSRVHSTTNTALNAFQLKEGETQNMFEGPAPIVKERDACGVGFIANTKSGGEYIYIYIFLRLFLYIKVTTVDVPAVRISGEFILQIAKLLISCAHFLSLNLHTLYSLSLSLNNNQQQQTHHI